MVSLVYAACPATGTDLEGGPDLKRKWLRRAALVALAAVILAGCGSSGGAAGKAAEKITDTAARQVA